MATQNSEVPREGGVERGLRRVMDFSIFTGAVALAMSVVSPKKEILSDILGGSLIGALATASLRRAITAHNHHR